MLDHLRPPSTRPGTDTWYRRNRTAHEHAGALAPGPHCAGRAAATAHAHPVPPAPVGRNRHTCPGDRVGRSADASAAPTRTSVPAALRPRPGLPRAPAPPVCIEPGARHNRPRGPSSGGSLRMNDGNGATPRQRRRAAPRAARRMPERLWLSAPMERPSLRARPGSGVRKWRRAAQNGLAARLRPCTGAEAGPFAGGSRAGLRLSLSGLRRDFREGRTHGRPRPGQVSALPEL